ncbi:glycosyltransferase [Deinococcus yavapaiensis]|uniref:Glycosyltransferase involved in cell wall biosynthesis n=1 Tax=Deinococcus yavapaiensis KR-236 TaxID=694435 RepID=A0A318S4Q7_9DEIO|nr:glycosyltransferase family 2 protein [Deinococcus yavapaiensis]PYE53583.1 glycosyltransferase involved in cell wall biosynthesis [Deinococcus yavapaiensis KR-236]
MKRPLDDVLRGFFAYKLTTLALNLLTFEVLKSGASSRHAWPKVSLLVPARNEARNLAENLPSLLSQGAYEVIVLDDDSSDGTATVAEGFGANVISGRPLPLGWHGKTWACQQLAWAASGDILIFTDADVRWHDGALQAVMRTLLASKADLLSVWPRQVVGSLGERLIVPLNDDVLLTLLPAPLIRLPFASASAGNGQLMAFWRAAYERVGGHAIVKGEVLEDVKFAARLKARGGRLALALGGDFVSVRMYRDYGAVVEGFGKSLLAAHGRVRILLALSWLAHFLAYTLPLAQLLQSPLRRRGLLRRPLDFVLFALLERALVNVKTGRTRGRDLLEVLLTPIAPIAALPVYWRALQGRYTWKGRTYERGRATVPPCSALDTPAPLERERELA